MLDRTGRTVSIGETVDIILNGVFQAIVVDIKDVPMILPNGQKQPPQVLLAVSLAHVPQDGKHCGFYIVGQSQPQEPGKLLVQ